ncbi:metalloregulator ArsR/SmtB family transcription factor [Motiliproteus sediminis]|uniref:metalloregulator ArsR/SmtB family transcription factor n=1 Tax=Motiliproteus sediminis TaxID=1468178 RepID=UPI001AEFA7B8|nr:metalloregulator ArsR/SmtB family transcription factor [Motiliproteus sediminis]
MLDPLPFFKALADETRLRIVLLLQDQGELCVCEIVHALELSQPKVSRHLSQLRSAGVLSDRRQGQWIFYAVDRHLPAWAEAMLGNAAVAATAWLDNDRARLLRMGDRPQRQAACC